MENTGNNEGYLTRLGGNTAEMVATPVELWPGIVTASEAHNLTASRLYNHNLEVVLLKDIEREISKYAALGYSNLNVSYELSPGMIDQLIRAGYIVDPSTSLHVEYVISW